MEFSELVKPSPWNGICRRLQWLPGCLRPPLAHCRIDYREAVEAVTAKWSFDGPSLPSPVLERWGAYCLGDLAEGLSQGLLGLMAGNLGYKSWSGAVAILRRQPQGDLAVWSLEAEACLAAYDLALRIVWACLLEQEGGQDV